MKYYLLLFITLCFISCDDPSLDNHTDDGDGIVEPIEDLRQLSAIQVAETTATNIIRAIDFTYDNDNRIYQIDQTGTINETTLAFYNGANQLIALDKTTATPPENDIQITYDYDDSIRPQSIITLSYTDTSNQLIEKTLYIDEQNRVDQVIKTQTDLSGNTTQIEDLEFQYSQNFNVLRINSKNDLGFIIAYSDFTYNFNNNPFTDMNDVLRLFMFDEFVPYSRYLPATRMDYDLSSGSAVLERSIDYTYTLDDEDFPISRELTVTETGTTTIYFEFFNYRP